MKKNIAVYCRVSSLDQARFGFSLNDQERRIRAYLNAMEEPESYEIEVFREEGVSAKNTNRPELQRLLQKVHHHDVDEIYILTLSRLTRNVSDLCMLIETFNQHNVQFASLTEKIDTRSAHGRFFVYMLGCLAQLEREEISERTNRGLEESAMEGNYPVGNHPPFGYKKVNKKLVPDEASAAIVKEIFEKIAYEDYSVFLLSVILNQTGAGNVKWTVDRIYKTIRNPIYYGTLEYKSLHIENHSPAIISEDLWNKANSQLKHYRKATPGKYIFKGYVVCAKCKRPLVGKSTLKKKTKTRYLYYYCYDCKKNMAEAKIMRKINTEMSIQLRIYEYDRFVKKLSANHTKFSSLFSKLDYAKMTGVIEEEFYCKEMDKYKEEWAVILRQLTNAFTKIKKMQYSETDFLEQRRFLSDTIKEIQIDFEGKNIKIIWK